MCRKQTGHADGDGVLSVPVCGGGDLRRAPGVPGLPGLGTCRGLHRQRCRTAHRRPEAPRSRRVRFRYRLRATPGERNPSRYRQDTRRTRGRRRVHAHARPGAAGRFLRTALRVAVHRPGPDRQDVVPAGDGGDRRPHRDGVTGHDRTGDPRTRRLHPYPDRRACGLDCDRNHRPAVGIGCIRGMAMVAGPPGVTGRVRLARGATSRRLLRRRRTRCPRQCTPLHRRTDDRDSDLCNHRGHRARYRDGDNHRHAVRGRWPCGGSPDVAGRSRSVVGHECVVRVAHRADHGSDSGTVDQSDSPAALRINYWQRSLPAP